MEVGYEVVADHFIPPEVERGEKYAAPVVLVAVLGPVRPPTQYAYPFEATQEWVHTASGYEDPPFHVALTELAGEVECVVDEEDAVGVLAFSFP
jgi:hypothetical protein